ncbi:hypothetical protein LJC02_01885 [Breznakia sp. OttesenSCG-928-G09]|nr:hypothetical protein [Breznakia sp. OttesenSCG-928-G09]
MPVVTIFNKKYDKATREDMLIRTVLEHKRIRWESSDALTINGQGVTVADQTTVYIPLSLEGYVSPKEYQSLEDISNKWTIQNGDIVIKGEVLENLSHSELEKKYDEVRVVQSVDTNDFSITEMLKHFEITAK